MNQQISLGNLNRKDLDRDKIGTEALLKVIEQLVDSVANPSVFGLNSAYGTGKTWFLNRLEKRLKQKKIKSVKIDAWKNDVFDDALPTLIRSFHDSFAGEYSEIYKEASIRGLNVLRHLIPLGVKIASGGIVDIEKPLDAALGDSSKSGIDQKIIDQISVVKKMDEYKASLSKFADKLNAKTGHNLVVIIDELDRCRPSFAIKTLEVIKHFFQIPNVQFVIAFDGKQLANSVCSLYGANFDGGAYLERFFDIQFSLPKPSFEFLKHEWKCFGFAEWKENPRKPECDFGDVEDFFECFQNIFFHMNLSMRLQQKVLARLTVIRFLMNDRETINSFTLSPLIVLSVLDRDVIDDFFSGSKQAGEIIDLIWSHGQVEQLFNSKPNLEFQRTYLCCVGYLVYCWTYKNRLKSADAASQFQGQLRAYTHRLPDSARHQINEELAQFGSREKMVYFGNGINRMENLLKLSAEFESN